MSESPKSAELDTLSPEFLDRINDLPTSTTVCISKEYQIPDGWVIVAETVLHQLLGKWPNAWIIKKPEETETVCSVSPIPDNYVKIEHVDEPRCPGTWPNAWKIERLTSATDE